MSGLKSYKDLDVWNVAMSLVVSVYKLTRSIPDTERYGLVSQMQRCSVSIPSNIAEGQARGTAKFGLHFVRIAVGSAAELSTHLEIARRLSYVTQAQTREVDTQLERVQQMLYGMRREHLRRLGMAELAIVLSFVLCRL